MCLWFWPESLHDQKAVSKGQQIVTVPFDTASFSKNVKLFISFWTEKYILLVCGIIVRCLFSLV